MSPTLISPINDSRAPVAFLVFNRPQHTARVFAAIRELRPSTLLVVADGPRANHPGDEEACKAVRQLILTGVDWPCELKTHFAATNLGCGACVSSGIQWVFEQVDRAIFLEDDCLPHPSFFDFCEELLTRYQDDERIMMISGCNIQFGWKATCASYYFSRCMHIWGWATWRRAWKHYDFAMRDWPRFREDGLLRSIFPERKALAHWTQLMERTFSGEFDTWDYQWMFACWRNGGLAAVPSANLVTNIGCDSLGMHTNAGNPFALLPVHAMSFPLLHPDFILRHFEADRRAEKHLVGPGTILGRLRTLARKLGSLLPAAKKP